MENMTEGRIVEEFSLPSGGNLYEEVEIDPFGAISSMKTKHEMLRLSSTDESHKIMASILDDCIASDIGISAYDLCLGDYQYLLFKLRTVTFGNEYTLRGKCPFCGFEQESVVNLDELTINEYDETYEDLKTLELPTTKHTLRLTYQTPRILDRINVKVKEYKRRHGADENPVLLFNIMSVIEEIDDEAPNRVFLEDWVKDLPLADSIAIINRIDEMNNKLGISLLHATDCKICGTEYYVPFRINETFFRPGSR